MNRQEIDKEINRLIDEELSRCNDKVYPTICRMKNDKTGIEKVRELVKKILKEQPMSIASAMALVDSSY